MRCPRCAFAHDAPVLECAHCGIVVAKYMRASEIDLAPGPPTLAAAYLPQSTDAERARRELYVRALALPCALVMAQVTSAAMPLAANILAMWVHEAGHAVAAWLAGFMAFPGPWITVVGDERSLFVTVVLVGLLSYGGYVAWERRRWFWVVAAVIVVVLALFCTFALRQFEADQLVTFSGDGGSFVLGTVLMLTMYAREDHPVRRERLRWVFLVIGALAFVDARATWSGGVDSIPFGEDDRGLSDPSVLMEEHGWSASLLIGRYIQLSNGCFAMLAVGYIAGLVNGCASSSSERRADSPLA